MSGPPTTSLFMLRIKRQMKASYNYKQIGNTCINKQRRHVEVGNETKKTFPSRKKNLFKLTQTGEQ